jgi:hypothetical protein
MHRSRVRFGAWRMPTIRASTVNRSLRASQSLIVDEVEVLGLELLDLLPVHQALDGIAALRGPPPALSGNAETPYSLNCAPVSKLTP